MRARLAASAACDTAGLCRALEQIYRQFRDGESNEDSGIERHHCGRMKSS
jgi:hypothetical protein